MKTLSGWTVAVLALLSLRVDPLWAFTNGQNANFVLGQSNFTSNGTSTGQSGLNTPGAVAYDAAHGRLFVSDSSNNRILVYNATPGIIANGENASYVLGQPGWATTSCDNTGSQTGMCNPDGMVYDAPNQRLFVADQMNSRVLVFNVSASSLTYWAGLGLAEPASHVLGQSGWVAPVPATTRNGLNQPTGLGYDAANSRLFVAEFTQNRVLVFNVSTMTISDGENADHVLGQANFTDHSCATTVVNFCGPDDMAYDAVNTRLFVSDVTSNRVMIFNVAPASISDGEFPDHILGQSSYTSINAVTAANGMNSPQFTEYDSVNSRLFVSEGNPNIATNNRVLIFNVAPSLIADDEPADIVLGQPDFNSNFPATTANGMNAPDGAQYDAGNNRLFVADSKNNRILVFPELSGCGGLAICGTITAGENPNPPLSGIPVELRDGRGTLIATQKTAGDGTYRFAAGLVAGSNYYVAPAVGRTQSAVPLQIPVVSLQASGATANFKIRGWPATLNISGNPPGSVILISTFSYTGSNPPSMNAASANRNAYFSTTAGLDGTVAVKVPAGYSYYITCWQSQPALLSVGFSRVPASGSHAPTDIVAPNDVITIPSCS